MSDLHRLVRELRQRLEVNRLFGWDVPLRMECVPAPRPARGVVEGAHASAPGRTTPQAAGTYVEGRRFPVAPGTPQTSGRSPDGAGERARREALLDPWRAAVAACTRCPLSLSRTRTVFGAGDPTARLLFVGEAPGFDEDRQGEPFVGRAGRLLDDIIRAMGLRREDVYIANVVKCHPPQNRTPDVSETGSCREYLDAQLAIVSPEVIIALGGVAAKVLLGTELSVGRLRGRFHEHCGPSGLRIPVMPTYHPAYLLRSPEEKRKTWEDVQLVMARLGLTRR